MLLAELAGFVTRHRLHGQLTADAPSRRRAVTSCSCGVVFMRWVTPGDATRELVLSDLLASES